MYILGISAWYHDSAACLIKNGDILAAAQEERFTRIKHDKSFPSGAIKYCINEANILPDNIDQVVFYEKPFLKFERLLETYLAFAPNGFKSFSMSMPLWIKEKLFQKYMIITELSDLFDQKVNWQDKLLFSEHHLSHAASAFYPSPFESAAILTMDGVGEWTTTSLALGNKEKLKVLKEIHFPHSLGLLYSAFTYYTGFKVNSGEYKVMGLAPYGKPKYVDTIKEHLIDIKEDGSFRLNLKYFDYCTGLTMTNSSFNRLFGGPPRSPESDLRQKDMDLAASIQAIAEEVVIRLARDIKEKTKEENLCLAGGVALNCVANGALSKLNLFKNIWIQPAAGDAGGSLGAALAIHFLMNKKKRKIPDSLDSMKGSYLGPSFSNDVIRGTLSKVGAVFNEFNEDEIIDLTARKLSEGKAIGWMQGRMEFGPRALGNRSIIADPRSSVMQKQLNLKVKYRESFRPFAPSILREHSNEWFEQDIDSPYMLLVSNVAEKKCNTQTEGKTPLRGVERINEVRSEIPAVTHIDFSARLQTVHKETNPIYWRLISKFYELTGCPLVVNTSFNVRGEPIVCSPEEAFKCFMGTELDCLVIGNLMLDKENQDPSLAEDYKDKYDLD
tara:strand:+ start:1601 stop:3439 length:1839 start_codon:yes stop_codon:yes gene_type:complete